MLITRFQVSDAHVTAMAEAGPLFVRSGLMLVAEEGRQEAMREDGQVQPDTLHLEYFCRLTVEGANEPDSWDATDADIIVTGRHENRGLLTIAGKGSYGFDDHGSLEVEFSRPPQMALVGPE